MNYHLWNALRAFIPLFSLLLLFAATDFGHAQVLYQNDFNQYSTERVYTDADLDLDWNNPRFNNGVTEGRVSIVGPSEAFGGTGSALAVSYPAGQHGTRGTGAQWPLEFENEFEELRLSYRVRFEEGFDFVRGGKLPGLAGGSAPTGNAPADGTNGWTGRLMWRTSFGGVSGNPQQLVSNAISYAKYTDSGFDGTGRNEDREYWVDNNNQRVVLLPNRWYQIEQRVKMNQAGQRDGILQIWLDGQLVHDQQDVLFRTVDTLKIDQMYFSTFFGGGSSWQTSKDEIVYFDDFVISIPQEAPPEEEAPEEEAPQEAPPEEEAPEEAPPEEETPEEAPPEEAPPEEEAAEEVVEMPQEEETPSREPRFIRVPGDFNNIQTAVDAALAGDTVAIRGSHHGNFVVDKAILFRGYTGTRIIAANRSLPVIRVTADNVRVRRLVLRRGSEGVLVESGNENVTIESLKIFDATYGVKVKSGCHDALLSKITARRARKDGIAVYNSNDVDVIDSSLFSCSQTGIRIAGGARVNVEDNFTYDNGTGYSVRGFEHRIYDNVANENNGTGFVVIGNYHEVLDNYSRQNGSHGYAFYEASNGVVSENLSRFNQGNGYQFLNFSDDNLIIDNDARFGGRTGFLFHMSSQNEIVDIWADENVYGIIFTESTMGNSLTRSRSEDNQRHGLLDRGINNTQSGNVIRRNGS